MKNRTLFIVLFSTVLMFSAITLKGQDQTKKKIVHYLIKVGDLENNVLKDKNVDGWFFVVNQLTREAYKDGQNGVFAFGAFSAHCGSYILLKDDSTFTILNLKDLDADLLSEIAFLKKHKFSSDEIIKYIESTIKTDQHNQYIFHKSGVTFGLPSDSSGL